MHRRLQALSYLQKSVQTKSLRYIDKQHPRKGNIFRNIDVDKKHIVIHTYLVLHSCNNVLPTLFITQVGMWSLPSK